MFRMVTFAPVSTHKGALYGCCSVNAASVIAVRELLGYDNPVCELTLVLGGGGLYQMQVPGSHAEVSKRLEAATP